MEPAGQTPNTSKTPNLSEIAAVQAPLTSSSSKAMAGYYVRQLGSSSTLRQTPQAFHNVAEKKGPMIAVTEAVSVSEVPPTAILVSHHNVGSRSESRLLVNPSMTDEPRQVSAPVRAGAVTQSVTRQGEVIVPQGVQLGHSELMQTLTSNLAHRLPPVTTVSSTGGIGPIHHTSHHDNRPYARPEGSTKSQGSGKVFVPQQAPVQGSIRMGTPVVSGQQPYGNVVTDGAYGSDQSGMRHVATSQQSSHTQKKEGDSSTLTRQRVSAGNVSHENPAPNMTALRWAAFMRAQHNSLPYFLNNMADDLSCPYVERALDNPHRVFVNMQAYQDGYFPMLGPHLANLLLKEANHPSYGPVQWCGGAGSYIVADISWLTLATPPGL